MKFAQILFFAVCLTIAPNIQSARNNNQIRTLIDFGVEAQLLRSDFSPKSLSDLINGVYCQSYLTRAAQNHADIGLRRAIKVAIADIFTKPIAETVIDNAFKAFSRPDANQESIKAFIKKVIIAVIAAEMAAYHKYETYD